MKRKVKIITRIITLGLVAIGLAITIPLTIFAFKSFAINNNYEYLRNDATYSEKVEINGLNLVTQEVSCGYATIEMISDFYGNKVTENDLKAKNKGGISTSTTSGFLKEINESIPNKKFSKYVYQNNDMMLKEIHISLSNNNPVAIEWAAKYENSWTLHFSVVTKLDLKNDSVTIYNPYGFIEEIDVDSFISRTTFKAYKGMPLFLTFGFAYGAFHKNTLFFAN